MSYCLIVLTTTSSKMGQDTTISRHLFLAPSLNVKAFNIPSLSKMFNIVLVENVFD